MSVRVKASKMGWSVVWAVVALSLSAIALQAQNIYTRTNLVSDIAGVANFTDPKLVNAWALRRARPALSGLPTTAPDSPPCTPDKVLLRRSW